MSTGVVQGLHSTMPARKNLQHVLTLGEQKAGTIALNVHPPEVVELAQVLHGELRLECSDGALEELSGGSGEDDVVNVEQQVDQVSAAAIDEQ